MASQPAVIDDFAEYMARKRKASKAEDERPAEKGKPPESSQSSTSTIQENDEMEAD